VRYNARMAVLKDRLRFPPRGFQLLLPEIGMKAPVIGSFNEVVTAFDKIVRANPALAEKHNWPTDREGQENWIDQREAARMIAHGWLGFVDMEGEHAPPPLGGVRRNANGLRVAVDSAMTGLAIYRELFTVGKPVAKEVAEARAAVCVECPMNRKGNLKDWFAAHISKGIMELYALLKDSALTTTRDKELGTCSACLCPLRAKIFIDAEMLKRHTKPDVLAALDHRCWILSEIAGKGTQQPGASSVG
jgi:hypothetical protein